MMNISRKPLFLVIAIAGVLAGAGFGMLNKNAARTVQNATVFQLPRDLPALQLLDHDGQALTRAHFSGNWSVLFFGFTHCPDVCPMTLSVVANAYQQIEQAAPDKLPKVYMVSVDPDRDDIETLATYVPFFHPSFTGVTGTPENIADFTGKLGVAYSRTPTDDGDYNIDHTSALFFINPAGQLAAVSTSPHLPDILANDYLAIITQ